MSYRALVCCITACIVFIQGANSKESIIRYNVRINERGAIFREAVEIGRKNTVIYHVPHHNNVEQSDLLMDYKQKLSVLRVPVLKECHVEKMAEDESQPKKVMHDLVKFKVMYHDIPKRLRIIKRKLIRIGIFENPSTLVREFCGSYPIFKMEIIEVVDSDKKAKGHEIHKRSTHYLRQLSKHIDRTYGEQLPPTDDDGDDDNDDGSGSGSGYGSGDIVEYRGIMAAQQYKEISEGHCTGLGGYKIDDCVDAPQRWNLTESTTHTCVYKVKCQPSKIHEGKVIQGNCIEEHYRSATSCYNLSCKPPPQA